MKDNRKKILRHIRNRKKKMSNAFIHNSVLILWTLLLVFVFVLVVSILAFEAGILFGKNINPFGVFLFTILLLFCLVFCYFYHHITKINDAIKDHEEATEQVAKGDFNIEVELTSSEDINSFILNFNKMVHELDNMETLKEDFISNVSHEFKTPLTVIQSYSKALQKPDLDPETRKIYGAVLDQNIKKLSTLTTNILSLSRLENQEIALNKKTFLIDEQIRQSILNLEPQWSKKNIDFKLELPRTEFFGPEELLEQVWQNIIGNAIKFSNENGEIAISLSKTDDDVHISIADNGIGMDETTCAKVFEKFYQGDTSHSSEGNGLGLALVKRIVKICDGLVSVKSELGKGTTFFITLPNSPEK